MLTLRGDRGDTRSGLTLCCLGKTCTSATTRSGKGPTPPFRPIRGPTARGEAGGYRQRLRGQPPPPPRRTMEKCCHDVLVRPWGLGGHPAARWCGHRDSRGARAGRVGSVGAPRLRVPRVSFRLSLPVPLSFDGTHTNPLDLAHMQGTSRACLGTPTDVKRRAGRRRYIVASSAMDTYYPYSSRRG